MNGVYNKWLKGCNNRLRSTTLSDINILHGIGYLNTNQFSKVMGITNYSAKKILGQGLIRTFTNNGKIFVRTDDIESLIWKTYYNIRL